MMMFNQGMFGGYDGGRGIGAQRFSAFGGQQMPQPFQMGSFNQNQFAGGSPGFYGGGGQRMMRPRMPMQMNPWAGSAQDPYASMGGFQGGGMGGFDPRMMNNRFSLGSLLGQQGSPQMSDEFRYQMPGSGGMRYEPPTGGAYNPMTGTAQPSVMPQPMPSSDIYTPPMPVLYADQQQAAQQQATQQPAAPQQTLEQFTATLGNPGAYTSGQIGDMYQKSLQSAQSPQMANYTWKPPTLPGNPGGGTNPTNPGGGGPGTVPPGTPPNTPPAGTPTGGIGNGAQPPAGFYQGLWDAQRNGQLGFSAMDPRGSGMVNMQNAWFYGMDALGRPINQNTNTAYPTFRGAADGYNRSRPWIGG